MTAPVRRVRVAAFPRDPNPYQALLYEHMPDLGVDVDYLGELTPSHTLNVVLLPIEVAIRRARGLDIVHLHWVFGFALPFRGRARAVGRLSGLVFETFLWALDRLDVGLVWTAHNVLPHSPVFWDDVAARRRLAAAADLVLVHNDATREGLAGIGADPRRVEFVAHGPYPVRERPDDDGADRPFVFAFLGAIDEYKGVEDLVAAFLRLPGTDCRLVVAGRCSDPALADRLRAVVAGAGAGSRIDLRLRWSTDDEIAATLAAADVVVLPYRQVTTSGVAVLALSAAVPLVVPDLPGFADLPRAAVISYSGVESLDTGLLRALRTPRSELRAMGRRGRDAIRSVTWSDVAAMTAGLFREALAARAGAPATPLPR